jgi:amicoumacin kinase
MQVSDTIAAAGAEVFGVEVSSLHSMGGTDGVVYSCRRGSRAYIMKFVPLPEERKAGYAERIAFIHYLVENGVSIAAPVESLAGNLYEILPAEPDPFAVTLSPLASGRNPQPRNAYLWNEKLFTAWGQVMGRMHALARRYPAWNKDGATCLHGWREEYDSFARMIQEPKVRARWLALLDPLSELPIERDGYGLVHNDLHHWNFLYHPDAAGNQPITVVDFDVCGYHWFAQDMAIPLYHAVTETIHSGKAQRLEFARVFLRSFLDGYLKENDLDPAWLQRLPLFVNYREVLVYLALSRDWPAEHRARWQSNFLAEKHARIIRGEAVMAGL